MRVVSKSWIDLVGGRGPDHFMELVFDRDVRPLVRTLDTSGLVRTEITGERMFSELRAGLPCDAFDLYVDAPHADAVLANLRGTASANVWHYETLLVGAHRVWIEHGYGVASPETLAVERRLLGRAVAPGAGLVCWSIEYGGQGYPGGVAASGRSAVELAAALA